ncbi:MAG TPA: nucleotide sugar dehydrogenase [Acidimicrobiales bacterium]|jgi:UDP-glucose 6-dehydrogenase
MSGRIAVIGTGYVGLTTGACLAHLGHTVVCADIDAAKVERLNRGEVPILEAGLEEIVREGLAGGRLSFVVGAREAAAICEFAFLCVQTPMGPDGSADLSFIEAAAAEIAPVLPTDAVVVNKSTVPVGSTRVVAQALGREDVEVVSNPEFLREGTAVHDFLHPDRVVIGADDQSAAVRVASLYLGIPAPVIVTDPASAETIKYASNAFLATKVSFVNAIAAVCEAVGADVDDVVLGMGYDRRIGHEFLRPGPGWGGSCLAGDETVLLRRSGSVRLLRLEDAFAEVDRVGPQGWEVLAWRPDDPAPEFWPVAAFTRRPFDGDVVAVTTATGRRVVATADHPFVVGDGVDGMPVAVRPAGDLRPTDWLPVAQGCPVPDATPGPVRPSGRRVPDGAWALAEEAKRAVVAALWGAPAPEMVTRSAALVDGLVRLLGDLRVVATVERAGSRWRVAVDADQSEDVAWLVGTGTGAAGRRTGHRPLLKSATWDRVVSAERRPWCGAVYSLEVPGPATIVATGGLVVHNCFPKDTKALIRIAEDAGYDFDLLRGVVNVNDEQFDRVAAKVASMAGGEIAGVTVAAWGLTFKARTDDLRDSPAMEIIGRLHRQGAVVRAYDPAIRRDLEGITVVDDPYSACEGAEVLVVLTEWDEFRWLDFDKVKSVMAAPRVVDARNLLDRSALLRRGFAHEGIGRGG